MGVISVLLSVFKFWEDVKTFLAFRQQYTQQEWENEGQELTKAIKGATTDDERRALVKRIAAHDDNA